MNPKHEACLNFYLLRLHPIHHTLLPWEHRETLIAGEIIRNMGLLYPCPYMSGHGRDKSKGIRRTILPGPFYFSTSIVTALQYRTDSTESKQSMTWRTAVIYYFGRLL